MGNNFVFSLFNVNIGIGQNSTLFPILSALYILLIFHIFKKRSKNFNIPVLFLFFYYNRLLISQEKSFEKTNSFLVYNYNIILSLLKYFGLIIKHGKSEVFHFSNLIVFLISLLLISVLSENLFFA